MSVALAAVQRRHRSLIGVLVDAAPQIGRAAARALPVIREHVVSVAAFAAVDYGAFGLNTYAGWITTGVSAIVLDWLVRG